MTPSDDDSACPGRDAVSNELECWDRYDENCKKRIIGSGPSIHRRFLYGSDVCLVWAVLVLSLIAMEFEREMP